MLPHHYNKAVKFQTLVLPMTLFFLRDTLCIMRSVSCQKVRNNLQTFATFGAGLSARNPTHYATSFIRRHLCQRARSNLLANKKHWLTNKRVNPTAKIGGNLMRLSSSAMIRHDVRLQELWYNTYYV